MENEPTNDEILNAAFQEQLINNQLLIPINFEYEGKIVTDYNEASILYHLRNGNIHLLNRDTLNMIADKLVGKLKHKRGNKKKDDYVFRHFSLYPKYRELEKQGVIGKERDKILFEMMRKSGMGSSKKNLERLVQEEIVRERNEKRDLNLIDE